MPTQDELMRSTATARSAASLPAGFVLCERIDSAPMWLNGLWDREGRVEITLDRFRDAWLHDTRDRQGDGR
ncbi:hypothetical protein [Streptomyces umbrinus]|uniref:hypothetical protein n=1 Tax=Streptomyces umbrinus TaxID=67370 RepID=UPI00340E7A85